ncbi:MAG: NAD-dependent dehydratase, partial [Acidimicrobiia bacterium]
MTNDLHVVFGTGAIGLATIQILATRGTPVRAVSRSGRADVPKGVEMMTGDATDSAFAAKAA